MTRRARAALGAALVLATGCAGYRNKLADDAMRRGDYTGAMRLYKSLARRGHADAQFRVATMYALGQGARKNEDEAVLWFRRAARNGDELAQDRLAHYYLDGAGRPETDPDAERWLRMEAETGSADTRYRLGLMYFRGRVVPRSDDEALHWFRQAASNWGPASLGIGGRLIQDGVLHEVAELGLPEAQHRLGQLYAVGDGVPRSAAEAAKWQFLAANQGLGAAQLALAWAYGQGSGVPRDLAESARWFAKAAEQGMPEAQYQLGLLFDRGVGVPRDRVQAHMWFNLAAGEGHHRAKEKRETLTAELSEEQLAEAEGLAIRWQLDHRE
jgi:hypothetical protein